MGRAITKSGRNDNIVHIKVGRYTQMKDLNSRDFSIECILLLVIILKSFKRDDLSNTIEIVLCLCCRQSTLIISWLDHQARFLWKHYLNKPMKGLGLADIYSLIEKKCICIMGNNGLIIFIYILYLQLSLPVLGWQMKTRKYFITRYIG